MHVRQLFMHVKADKDKIDMMMLELQDEYVRCCLNCKCFEVWGWAGSGLTESKPLEGLLLAKPMFTQNIQNTPH